MWLHLLQHAPHGEELPEQVRHQDRRYRRATEESSAEGEFSIDTIRRLWRDRDRKKKEDDDKEKKSNRNITWPSEFNGASSEIF